jgi:cation diffusion facilitator family transporter
MKTERGALFLSCGTALLMAGLGLVFAFITNSRAIMLDGVYNLMYFGVALLTLRIERLTSRPDNARFPFGHAYFESLVNAGKGLMILGISAIALLDSGMSLWSGGRAIAAGPAIGYALAATILCTATALTLRRAQRTLDSPLIRADADNWVLDAVISAAVLGAFCLAPVFDTLGWFAAARYIDPILVAVVVIVFLGVPVRMAREAIYELLNRSPGAAIEQPVTAAIDEVLARLPVRERFVRMVRPGRILYVTVHVVLDEASANQPLTALDGLRGEVDAAVRAVHRRSVVDTLFTADVRWAAPSAGLAPPGVDTH